MANNQLLVSDNFASGSLAAGWTAESGLSLPQVVNASGTYVIEAKAVGTGVGMLWTAVAWPNNQVAEVTINAFTGTESTTSTSIFLRFSESAKSGYSLAIHPSTINIIRNDAGTQTVLTPLTSTSVSAGDVFTFCVSGAVLTAYQNGKFLGYAVDATYASGYPGANIFIQSTDTVSSVQISAWRGYSVVQQDGVWSKRGSVMPPQSGDGESGVQPSQVIYEGNAQILSGNVYKMWPMGWSPNNVYYMESTDGINWARAASAVLSGYNNDSIFKYSGTYYMYAQAANPGAIAALTSPDGITWTLQNSSAIVFGGEGDWDVDGIYFLAIADVIEGTWYGLYGGLGSTGGVWSTGLATSTNGINWTKYAGNPVISGFGEPNLIKKIGTTYYAGISSAQQGRGATNDNDPTETVIYTSTDLITWTRLHHSLHNTQLYESLNTITGQAFVMDMIDVGGKAYCYYMGSPYDPGGYQVCLAVGPSTWENILPLAQDGTIQIASDSFTSGAGNLDGNWTTPTGGTALQIVAGPYVEPTTTSTVCSAVYTGASFQSSQYSEIILKTLTGTLNQSITAPTVWASTAAQTWYEAQIGSPTATSDAAGKIYKRVAGTPTQIGPTATIEPQVGDVFRLSVVAGSDGFPVLSLFQNGFLILQVQDYSAAISSGNPGVWASSSVAIGDAQISSWAGGNANVIPPYPSGANWYPVDCRDYSSFPLTPVIVQGSGIYALDPNSDNSKLPPTDSRITKPTDDRVSEIIPENSRVNPNPNA